MDNATNTNQASVSREYILAGIEYEESFITHFKRALRQGGPNVDRAYYQQRLAEHRANRNMLKKWLTENS